MPHQKKIFKLTIVKGKSNVKFCCSDLFNAYFEYVQNIDLRNTIFNIKCDVLSGLESFVPFKKREKHTWRSATFNKVTLLKVTLLHRCF